mgnify:CR=1 FL=1
MHIFIVVPVQFIYALCNTNVKGLKIRINGRFNGAARSKTRVFQINKIPLQTLDANIQYYQSISYTLNGTFGVKLWVYTY